MARMTGDVAEIENSIMSSLDMLFKNPVMIIVCLSGMIMISWQLTIFVLVLLPIAGTVMGRVGKRLKRKSLQGQQQWGTIMSYIGNPRRSAHHQGFQCRRQGKAAFPRRQPAIFQHHRISAAPPVTRPPMSELLGTITVAIVLSFGGMLILSGKTSLTAPEFIYYMVIFYSIINPAKDLSKAVYQHSEGSRGDGRVDAILAATNPITDPVAPKEIKNLKGHITYRDVTFGYDPESPVVRKIDLDIPSGSTVALVGQSGSGKSTPPTFYPASTTSTVAASRSTVVTSATSASTNCEATWAMSIRKRYSSTTLFSTTYPSVSRTPQREQVIEAAKIANAHEFILATEQGLRHQHRRPRLPSVGRSAPAPLHCQSNPQEPPILILDEATSALDSEKREVCTGGTRNAS